MRRSVFIFVAAFFFLTSFAAAQVSSGNAFFGYSYASVNLNHGGSIGMNGFEGALEGKVAPFLGLVADFSGHYGNRSDFPTSDNTPVSVAASEYNFLFGPRVSVSVGRVRPFAQALFGGGHESVSGRGVHYSASDNSFAYALGGGLDYKVWGPVGWRFQGDFVQTRFFGNTQNDGRFSTGIVFHF